MPLSQWYYSVCVNPCPAVSMFFFANIRLWDFLILSFFVRSFIILPCPLNRDLIYVETKAKVYNTGKVTNYRIWAGVHSSSIRLPILYVIYCICYVLRERKTPILCSSWSCQGESYYLKWEKSAKLQENAAESSIRLLLRWRKGLHWLLSCIPILCSSLSSPSPCSPM